MKNELLMAYQNKLVFAGLDDFTGVSVLGGYLGGQFGASRNLWRQAAVDFLYRNLVSGLIEASPSYNALPLHSPKALCELFARIDPLDCGSTTISCWDFLYFDGTPALCEILKRHQLDNWAQFHAALNVNFMDEIETLYLQFGVSLSKEVLISIV